MKTKLVTVFEAEDGQEFTTAAACQRYEKIRRVKNFLSNFYISGSESNQIRLDVATLIVSHWQELTNIMNARHTKN